MANFGKAVAKAALFKARQAAGQALPAAAPAPPARVDPGTVDFGWPWQPRYPEWAKPVRSDADAVKTTIDPTASSWWLTAPGDSHIRKYWFRVIRGVPELRVQFKPSRTGKNAGRIAEYQYTWPPAQEAQARQIVRAMQQAAHPYGEVLYPRVIRAGVRYRPVAISG